MSVARRHQQMKMAALAAGALALAAGAAAPAPEGEGATAYERMLLKLEDDQRSLSALQSVERKIELKRQLLPDYAPWVQGVLQAGEQGRASQDDVFVTVMIWMIDAGLYAEVLPLAKHVLRFDLALPERYRRDAATLITEEMADAALKHSAQGEAVDVAVLVEVDELTAKRDMPDQVRAKIKKAIGFTLIDRAAATEGDSDGPAGGKRAAQETALAYLRRALELNEHVGVKKQIEQLERELKKDAPDAA